MVTACVTIWMSVLESLMSAAFAMGPVRSMTVDAEVFLEEIAIVTGEWLMP